MATPTASKYSKSYNSFSGVDMKVIVASKVIGELQGISYSITREKAPIYTMGDPNPRAISRGKRGIAGTLVLTMFDRHALLGVLGGLSPDGGLLFQADIDEIRPEFRVATSGNLTSVPLGSTSGVTPSDTVQNAESPITMVGGDQELASAWFADQIPPFDISLAAANEYGHLAVMRIFGAEILNEGCGMSIDDIMTEFQHTYIARSIVPWTPVVSKNATTIAEQGGVNLSSGKVGI